MFLKQHHNAFFPLVAEQIVVLVGRALGPMVSCGMFFWTAWKINSTLFDRMLNHWSSDSLLRERKRIPFGEPWQGLLNICCFDYFCTVRDGCRLIFPVIEIYQIWNVHFLTSFMLLTTFLSFNGGWILRLFHNRVVHCVVPSRIPFRLFVMPTLYKTHSSKDLFV